MKTILWTQNESTDIKPTIFVDGNICENEDKAQDAFNELCLGQEQLRISPQKSEELCKKHKDLSFSSQANYAVLNKPKGIYIQGCYLDRDVRGRKLPYMFLVTGQITFKRAIELLREQSEILNRKINEDEVRILHSDFRYSDKTIIVITTLIIFAICLWKFLTH